MATYDTSMSYSSMNEASTKISHAKQDLEDAKQNIKAAIDALAEGYTGLGYNAFKESWDSSEPKLQEMIEAIGRFSPQLDKAAQDQQELDQQNEARGQSVGM